MKHTERRGSWVFCKKAVYQKCCKGKFLPWLRELTRQYKERGVFPVLPSDLALLYTDKKDIEAALLASLLIPNTGLVERHIRELHGIIGNNPYEWIKSGGYKVLSTGDNMRNLLFGSPNMPYWKMMPLFTDIASLLRKKNIVETDMLKLNANIDRVRMSLVVMFSDNGIGLSLREPQKPVRCPNTKELRKFMNSLLCDKCRESEFDDMTEMFFDNSIDFLYAYFAWKELKRLYPAQMNYLIERYKMFMRWGETFNVRWDEILFKVNFNQ